MQLGGGFGATYVHEPGVGWARVPPQGAQFLAQRPDSADDGTSAWASLDAFSVVLIIVVGMFVCQLALMARKFGFQGALQRMFFPGTVHQQNRNEQQQQATSTGRTKSQRLDAVASAIHALPIATYHTREELEALSVAALQELIRTEGLTGAYLEKPELVNALLARCNSSATSCIVCQEEYGKGDVLRVLPCGHVFHLECVDRWFLSRTDYSRPLVCPLCNAPLPTPTSTQV